MPMYDRYCSSCGHQAIDLYEPIETATPPCPRCGGSLHRAWITTTANVIGDACDVWVKHGICHEDGSPRHYTSKAEMVRVAKEKGLRNRVRHIGRPGSDRSPYTSRWV